MKYCRAKEHSFSVMAFMQKLLGKESILTVRSEDKAKIDALVELAVSLECSYKLQESSSNELEDDEDNAEDDEGVEITVSSPKSWQAGIEEQLAEMRRLITESSQTAASPTPIIVEEEKVIEKIMVLSPEPVTPAVPAYMRNDYWVYVAQQCDLGIIPYIGITSQDYTRRWRDQVTAALQGEKRLSKWNKGNIAI